MADHDDRLNALRELVADFLLHHPTRTLDTVSLAELHAWSKAQTVQPTDPPAGILHRAGHMFDVHRMAAGRNHRGAAVDLVNCVPSVQTFSQLPVGLFPGIGRHICACPKRLPGVIPGPDSSSTALMPL
jgi:hypothetical protein